VQRATGSQAALSWLFALSSLPVVCAQLPLPRWAGDRLGLRRSMIAGLLLIAAGFGGRGRRAARRLERCGEVVARRPPTGGAAAGH